MLYCEGCGALGESEGTEGAFDVEGGGARFAEDGIILRVAVVR